MPEDGTIRDVIDWLIQTLGYFHVVKLKDTLLFLSGIAIGELLMIMLIGRFFYRIKKVENLGKATSVVFKHDGHSHYFTRVSNFYQAVEFLMLMAFMPFFRKREYTLEDEKRTRRFVHFLLAVTILLIIIGIILAYNPIMLPEYLPPEWQKPK